MMISTYLLCLLVGGPGPDAPALTSEVMLVKSGVEIVVKKDGLPSTVRLLGTDVPKTGSGNDAVERQSQTNHLRGLIAVGSKVRVVLDGDPKAESKGPLRAQIYRDNDNLWLNLAMIEQGFAIATKESPAAAHPQLLAAERLARQEERGMWAPDWHDKAAQPTKFERSAKSRTATRGRNQRQFLDTPPGGGVPALGMGLVAAGSSTLPFPTIARPYVDPVWQSDYGLGFGSSLMANPYSAFGMNPGFGGAGFGPGTPVGSSAAIQALMMRIPAHPQNAPGPGAGSTAPAAVPSNGARPATGHSQHGK